MDEHTLTKETWRVECHNERARKLTLPATLTIEQWIDTLNYFQWTCAYCPGPYEVLEHFIPLPLQGETSVFNCVPSCFGCNARKRDTHPAMLSWIAPSTLMYIRAYFSALHTNTLTTPHIKITTTPIERPDAIYTVKDISVKLQLCEKTVRRMMSNGKINGTLIHGKWKFSETDIAVLTSSETSLSTLQEVAIRLKVSDKTVRRWVHSGQLQALDLGRRLRFEEREIRRFMDVRRRERGRKETQ